MSHVQFDSFGEPLPQRVSRDAAQRPVASRVAMIAGMSLFWSLVVVIVSARALYFDPDFAAKFQQVADFSRAVRAALGV